MPMEAMGQQSWPKRIRQFLSELFGSAYRAHLERELVQAKLERDRVIADLRAENRELLNRLLAANKNAPITPQVAASVQRPQPPLTSWQALQNQAIAENARLEEEEQKKQSKEN